MILEQKVMRLYLVLFTVIWGIGAAIGPAMGGLIFDATNSYSIAFLIGAVAMLVVTLLIPLIRQETSSNFSETMKPVTTF